MTSAAMWSVCISSSAARARPRSDLLSAAQKPPRCPTGSDRNHRKDDEADVRAVSRRSDGGHEMRHVKQPARVEDEERTDEREDDSGGGSHFRKTSLRSVPPS